MLTQLCDKPQHNWITKYATTTLDLICGIHGEIIKGAILFCALQQSQLYENEKLFIDKNVFEQSSKSRYIITLMHINIPLSALIVEHSHRDATTSAA